MIKIKHSDTLFRARYTVSTENTGAFVPLLLFPPSSSDKVYGVDAPGINVPAPWPTSDFGGYLKCFLESPEGLGETELQLPTVGKAQQRGLFTAFPSFLISSCSFPHSGVLHFLPK